MKKCGYGINEDEFVMDQIVVGIQSNSTREKLWTEEELDFEKAKKICRSAERAEKEINTLHLDELDLNPISVNVIKGDEAFHCSRCGRKHERGNCPAYKKLCNGCGKVGHFAQMCKTKSPATDRNPQQEQTQGNRVNAIQEYSDSDDDFFIS